MNKVKQLTLLTACGVLSVSSAFAQPPGDGDDEATSGDVIFSATVEQQCGIDVIEHSAPLAFGENYETDTAEVKLINNDKDGKIKFKLGSLNDDLFGEDVTKDHIFFKTHGAVSDNQDAHEWEKGKEITRDDLKDNNSVNIAARVSIDESNLDADDYELVTNWIIECDD